MDFLGKKAFVHGRIWLEFGENEFFISDGKINLLELISETGSISKAAKELAMSYKAAWDIVKEFNTYFGKEIVLREKGGKGGGGASLSESGKKLIEDYRKLKNTFNSFLGERNSEGK